MKEIAEEAGVSEAMVYQHFASKDEVFRVAVLEPLEELVGELAELGGGMADLPTGRDRRAWACSTCSATSSCPWKPWPGRSPT